MRISVLRVRRTGQDPTNQNNCSTIAMYVYCMLAHPRGWGNVHNIQARTLQEQDLSNNIDKERRKSNLLRKIRDYAEDIRRQVKTKEGIVSLFKL